MKKWLNIVNAVLYGAAGILWICNSMEKHSGFYLILGLIWLVGAAIWIGRHFEERKDSQKEK